MEIKKFQEKCAGIVNDIDNKYAVKRNSQFSFTQLMEEIGELAREINSPKLRNKEIDKENLKGEFADVVLQLSILAKMFDINFEEAVESKIKILKERHDLQ